MSLFVYFGKVIAIQVLALLGYQLLLSRQAMGQWKRFYLLASLVISFLIPLITVRILASAESLTFANDISVISQDVIQVLPSFWSSLLGHPLFTLIGAIYLIGFGYQLNSLIGFLRSIRQQVKEASIQTSVEGLQLAALPYAVSPHTFFHWIFYTEGALPNAIMLAHESAHVRQWHSVDRLFIGWLKVVFWFNPMIFLYERAILLNHELLADRAVLNAGFSATEYQTTLLQELGKKQHSPPLACGINFSLTKKRFKMMHLTAKNRLRTTVNLLATFSIWIVLLFGFGQTAYSQAPIADTATEIAEETSNKELSQWLNSDSSNRPITFSPNPSFAELIEFKVYNRWGEVIYQSFDGSTTSIGWNGSQTNGEQADSGYYVYSAKVRLENGAEKNFTGDLYLKE